MSIWIKPNSRRDLNSAKLHYCSKFGNCKFNCWWVIAWTSPKWGKFWLWSSIWPWRSRSIALQNNEDLNQCTLHLWSKFSDPSLNGWIIETLTKVFCIFGPNLVILAWTGDELSRGQTWWRTDGRTDRRTDAGNDNIRRPKLASGKNDPWTVNSIK